MAGTLGGGGYGEGGAGGYEGWYPVPDRRRGVPARVPRRSRAASTVREAGRCLEGRETAGVQGGLPGYL